jgi:hypothetical protein
MTLKIQIVFKYHTHFSSHKYDYWPLAEHIFEVKSMIDQNIKIDYLFANKKILQRSQEVFEIFRYYYIFLEFCKWYQYSYTVLQLTKARHTHR